MATTLDTKTAVGEERFLLSGISWSFYQAFCDELEGRRVRLSYDRGSLEIMITKRPHEFYKTLLARIVEQTLLFFNIPVASGGSMTFQREDLEKGIEPDECWWIANEAVVRGRDELDFRVDPPPDLAIEVEITRSLVSRIGIHAALGVPEIWRYDGKTLRFCLLSQDGQYRDSSTSLAFPFLRPEHVEPFLRPDLDKDETTRIRQFVEWLSREQKD
jgi:Uma2 family endonuclease